MDREQNVRLVRGYECVACGCILGGRDRYDEHFDDVHADSGGED